MRIGAGGIDVVPEGKRRQRRAGLPRRAERHRGGGRRAETPSLVRALETAAAEAAEEDVLAIPEHHEVGDPIAVDVDGIGAVHGCEVRDWIAQPDETKGAPDGTVVPIERRRAATTCEVEIGPPIAVAVEDGDAAAGRVLETAVVGVLDTGDRGLFHKVRCRERDRRGRSGEHPRGRDGRDDRHEQRADRADRDHRWAAPGARPGIAMHRQRTSDVEIVARDARDWSDQKAKEPNTQRGPGPVLVYQRAGW